MEIVVSLIDHMYAWWSRGEVGVSDVSFLGLVIKLYVIALS